MYQYLVATLWERHIQNLILSSKLSEYICHYEHERTNYSPICKCCSVRFLKLFVHISVFQLPFFANEAYNIPEQLIVRVLISLPTNETLATFLVSAIVENDYSYSCMYRYFSCHSMKMRHTTFLSSVLSGY